MKKLALLFLVLPLLFIASCDKDDEDEVSERFRLLTTPVWESQQLLVNGVDASGSGGLLENFKGDAKFNADGTGNFGNLTGTWEFQQDETQIRIVTNAYPFPIVANIEELTSSAFRIGTLFPNPENPQQQLTVTMSFVAR